MTRAPSSKPLLILLNVMIMTAYIQAIETLKLWLTIRGLITVYSPDPRRCGTSIPVTSLPVRRTFNVRYLPI
jgi:hypothetical protein